MPRLNPFAWFGRTSLTKLWDTAIDGHVVSLAWSAPLGLLAAASAEGPVALFDAKTGARLKRQDMGHDFGASCVAWSADGQHLASAGQDGKVRLWNHATGEQLHELAGGAAWVDRIAWCPTSNLLASTAGKKLRLWNTSGELVREYPDHPSTIADIQWQPGTATLASAAYGKLSLWETAKSEPVREFAWQGSMLALAWSPDAKYIAAGAQSCAVHFWIMKTGKDLEMSGYPAKVRELAWDATSRYLATGGAEVSCVWDCSGKGPAGTEPIQLEGHKANISALAFQHRGVMLASGGEDGQLILWQPSKQRGSLALAKHDAPISHVIWSADDKFVAVGTADGALLVYEVS
jgi:WD40 repeat protein